jgi:RimJ/RimL family protein N-acetyltransferase
VVTLLELTFRPASMADAKILFEWRNDPDTRENSRITGELSWENHIGWLTSTVGGAISTRVLCIAERRGVPAGSVRSDQNERGEHELSWIVAPEARGQGVGKAMVVQFVHTALCGKKVIVSIREGNTPSEKIAQALGLRKAEREQGRKSENSHPFFVWR